VALAVFFVVGGAAVWGRQQEAARRGAEGRAEALQSQVVSLEASMTALVRAQAATASALAVAANEPEASLRSALDLVLEAYRDPSEAHLAALQAAFDPPALSVERPEAEHLISGGTHLGGQSDYTVLNVQASQQGSDRVQIQTREQWVYDEVDAENHRSRCVREETEQTYTLRRAPGGWVVADIALSGPGRRSDCQI
jgi:hypothetical protein